MAARRMPSGPWAVARASRPGAGRCVAAIAQRVDDQQLLVGRQLGQFRDQGSGDLRAGQFDGRARGGGRQHEVGTADGFQHQGDTGLLAGQDGAAQGRPRGLAAGLAASPAAGRKSPGRGPPAPGPTALRRSGAGLPRGRVGWRRTHRPGRCPGPWRRPACRSCRARGRRTGPPRYPHRRAVWPSRRRLRHCGARRGCRSRPSGAGP